MSACVPALLLLLAGCAGCGPAAAPPHLAPAGDVLASALWDDGRAEYSIYSGVTPQGGQERRTSASLIVVKEDLLSASLVKSDSGPIPGRTVTAIKCNFISDFRSGTYGEHDMATVMIERSSGRALKETASHADGCGITFVRVGPVNGRLAQQAHSYWQGEADRVTRIEIPAGGLVFEDALPVWLRRWAGNQPFPPELEVWMLPSQLGARAPLAAARPVRAVIRRVAGGDTLGTPAGRFPTVRFSIQSPLGISRYWLAAVAPHLVVRVERPSGAWLELRHSVRIDYWNHTRNGDERLVGETNPGP